MFWSKKKKQDETIIETFKKLYDSLSLRTEILEDEVKRLRKKIGARSLKDTGKDRGGDDDSPVDPIRNDGFDEIRKMLKASGRESSI